MTYDIHPGAVIHGDCLTILRQMEPDSEVEKQIAERIIDEIAGWEKSCETRDRMLGDKAAEIARLTSELHDQTQRAGKLFAYVAQKRMRLRPSLPTPSAGSGRRQRI